jgi:hypothetical protein
MTSLTVFFQPPLERRFEFNEAPRDLQLSYSMVLDTVFVKAYSPQPSDHDDFDRNWKQWFSGDPRKGGFGVKIEVAVSVSNHRDFCGSTSRRPECKTGVLQSFREGSFRGYFGAKWC